MRATQHQCVDAGVKHGLNILAYDGLNFRPVQTSGLNHRDQTWAAHRQHLRTTGVLLDQLAEEIAARRSLCRRYSHFSDPGELCRRLHRWHNTNKLYERKFGAEIGY